MKKSDLKTGMIVTCRNGEEYVVLRDVECQKSKSFTKDIFVHFDRASLTLTTYSQFDEYDDDLMIAYNREEKEEELDIIIVELPLTPYSIFDTGMNDNEREVLWVREEDEVSEDNPFEFIWGIKSADDLTGSEIANNYTMNDFDIVKDKESGEYVFSVETIFYMDKDAQKKYLQNILGKFTEWMLSQGYNTDYDLSYNEVFSKTFRADSIEECYAKFKMLVDGFLKGSKE